MVFSNISLLVPVHGLMRNVEIFLENNEIYQQKKLSEVYDLHLALRMTTAS